MQTSSLPTWQVVLSTVPDKGPGFRPSPRGRTETEERNGLGLPGHRRILVCQVQTLGYYLRRNFRSKNQEQCGEKLLRLSCFFFASFSI